MTRHFGLDSNSRGADEIKGLPISIDFRNRITELLLLFIVIMPWPLFVLRFWIIFNMLVYTNFTVDKRLVVKKWNRGGGYFLIKGHYFAKKELKSSAFFLKSVANLLLWNNGGITGILRLFREFFNRVQYAFLFFWMVFNFCDNLKKYFTLNH